jgi:hypothetical protein
MNLYRIINHLPSLLFLRVAVMAALAASSAAAQADTGTDKSESAEVLRKRIDELEATQKQMQEKIDALSQAGAAADAQAAPPADPTDHTHTLGPVQFQGFSDFDYGRAWFEKLPVTGLAGSPQSFTIGDFDLFTNMKISERWSVLGELLVTSDETNEFSVELDRFLFTYRHNQYFKISFGRFSTALGYYTNAFHRAQYFQTGVGRPIMYSDEDNGGILPVHNVGVTATGKIPSGSLGLNWVAEVANGRSAEPNTVPVQNFVDQNNGKALNLAAYIKPDWLRGFETGFSVYRDTLHPSLGSIGEIILSAHAVYVGSKLEWLNEGSLLRHDLQAASRVYHSTTSYSQASWAFGKTRPYVRYDYQNVPSTEPIFGDLPGSLGGSLAGSLARWGPSIGVNRRISDYVALKLQYGRLSQRYVPTANGFTAQLALAF